MKGNKLKVLGSLSALIATGYAIEHRNETIRKTRNRRIMLATLPLAALSVQPLLRKRIQKKVADAVTTITTDEYNQNIMELWTAIKRADIHNIMEINLRATQGTAITRPIGTPKKFDGYDNIMFIPPQLTDLSKPGDTKIDMEVVIGKKASKPLILPIPLIISGMAYGIALSEKAKRALARGAKTAGTAICSGEGPYLEEERREAGKYILQISNWPWGLRRDEEILAADMLEIQVGQGAQMGSYYVAPEEIKGKARRLMGLPRNEGISRMPAPPGIRSNHDWPIFFREIRQRTHGIPIGIKMMATEKIEEELAKALEYGVDVIAIDGAQGGALNSNPTMQDDFGIPSLHALVRAVKFLNDQKVRDQVSLIVSGGYFNPGSCLKAIALGADAIYLGTLPLYAMVNKQHQKVLPWEPPTTLVSYASKYNHKLDIGVSAERVANVLRSLVVEMEQVLRSLGKTSLHELSPKDLVALDDFSSQLTGIKKAY
ncbi:FMN-binding glutamate synthase family protein [Desulfosporosinus sp. SYSU MS00001]|uniref:FMN-binding glutamate synthase family protein n=1 Tax=Desulfosporosinus sp. SYSU MS00001 TaxID=3416284 RepID=UPI003CEF17BA